MISTLDTREDNGALRLIMPASNKYDTRRHRHTMFPGALVELEQYAHKGWSRAIGLVLSVQDFDHHSELTVMWNSPIPGRRW